MPSGTAELADQLAQRAERDRHRQLALIESAGLVPCERGGEVWVKCCQGKRGIGLRRFDEFGDHDYGCPRCACETSGCEIKGRPSGRCADHERYFERREQESAEFNLPLALTEMEQRVLELALILVAPCHRAIREIDAIWDVLDTEREARGLALGAEREFPVLDLRHGHGAALRSFKGDTCEYQYEIAGHAAPEARDDIRRCLDEIESFLRPEGTSGFEPFCRHGSADALIAAGVIDKSRKAAIYTEAVDE